MCEALLGLTVACLAVFGLVWAFRIVSMALLSRSDLKEGFMLILPVCGHDEAIEMTLRGLVADAKWLGGGGKPQRVICLDLGLDAETRKICKIFSEEYNFIELHSLQTFNEAMEQAAVTAR